MRRILLTVSCAVASYRQAVYRQTGTRMVARRQGTLSGPAAVTTRVAGQMASRVSGRTEYLLGTSGPELTALL
jgi:hypothetical protein